MAGGVRRGGRAVRRSRPPSPGAVPCWRCRRPTRTRSAPTWPGAGPPCGRWPPVGSAVSDQGHRAPRGPARAIGLAEWQWLPGCRPHPDGDRVGRDPPPLPPLRTRPRPVRGAQWLLLQLRQRPPPAAVPGRPFDSDNDSEVAARFLAGRLAAGDDLEEATRWIMKEMDGFFTLVIATADAMSVVRDAFACKPAVVAETDRLRRRGLGVPGPRRAPRTSRTPLSSSPSPRRSTRGPAELRPSSATREVNAALRRPPPATVHGGPSPGAATTWPWGSPPRSRSASRATPAISSAASAATARAGARHRRRRVRGVVGGREPHGRRPSGCAAAPRRAPDRAPAAGHHDRRQRLATGRDLPQGRHLAIAGDAGAMSGFMAQAGTILIGGDAGHGLATPCTKR